MTKTVSTRLSADLVRALDELARNEHGTRSDALREVVKRGIAARRLDLALDAYRAGRASLGRASAMAGLPATAFLDEIRRAGLLLNYDLEELRHDLEQVGCA